MEKTNASKPTTTKGMNDLIGFTYQDLVEVAVKGVRKRAETIPAFAESKNGCIRIGILPLCEEAETWLGGNLSRFPEDVRMREFNHSIFQDSSRTIQWQDPQNGHSEPISHYSYSALKAAGLMNRRLHVLNNPLPSEEQQYITEENGYSSQDKGTLEVRMNDKEFFWLVIVTSGATPTENLKCSYSGLLSARELFTGGQPGVFSWIISLP